MSLQVWLPLNGNLNNQGLDPLNSLSASSVTFADGKLGKCLNNNGIKTTTGIFSSLNGIKQYTIAAWIKINTANTNSNYVDIISLRAQYDDSSNSLFRIEHTNTNGAYQIIHGKSANYGSNTNPYHSLGSSTTAAKDKWCHICITNDEINTKYYLNGVLTKTTANSAVYGEHFLTGEVILGNTGSYSMINDLRIYDNVISLKEIQLLSQGLFIHYPLRDPYMETATNIIDQPVKTSMVSNPGWDINNHIGAINVSNWTNGYNNGVTNADKSKTPEKGYHAHWIEMDGIPTIKFPNVNKPITGNNRWLGIAQSGKQLQNLIGPDTTYTISFDAMSTVPGMNVRMGYYFYNTSGARDFHDGHCEILTTTSWKRYSKTITCKSNMDNTKASFFYLYGHYGDVQGISYVRNIQVEINDHSTGFIEGTSDSTICYDCSGFNNHANIIGTVESKQDGMRGDRSLYITDGRTNYLKTNEITIPTDTITLSCWFKASAAGYSNYHIPINFGSGHCELSIDANGKIKSGFYAPSRFVDTGANTSIFDGEWHLLTTTFNGTTIKRYVDGIATTNTAITSAPQKLQYSTGSLFIGNYNGTTYGNKNANMCDVRIYATALSAEDILELYNTPIVITDNQNIISNEFKEVE